MQSPEELEEARVRRSPEPPEDSPVAPALQHCALEAPVGGLAAAPRQHHTPGRSGRGGRGWPGCKVSLKPSQTGARALCPLLLSELEVIPPGYQRGWSGKRDQAGKGELRAVDAAGDTARVWEPPCGAGA